MIKDSTEQGNLKRTQDICFGLACIICTVVIATTTKVTHNKQAESKQHVILNMLTPYASNVRSLKRIQILSLPRVSNTHSRGAD